MRIYMGSDGGRERVQLCCEWLEWRKWRNIREIEREEALVALMQSEWERIQSVLLFCWEIGKFNALNRFRFLLSRWLRILYSTSECVSFFSLLFQFSCSLLHSSILLSNIFYIIIIYYYLQLKKTLFGQTYCKNNFKIINFVWILQVSFI